MSCRGETADCGKELDYSIQFESDLRERFAGDAWDVGPDVDPKGEGNVIRVTTA